MPAPETRTVPIDRPRPSQLSLDAHKLSLVAQWFDFDDPEYDPIPVVRIDGDLALADGHTRAFAAHLAGTDELRVTEVSFDEPTLAVYRECLEWCREEEIAVIADLAGRVVSAETYEEEWVQRCHAIAPDS